MVSAHVQYSVDVYYPTYFPSHPVDLEGWRCTIEHRGTSSSSPQRGSPRDLFLGPNRIPSPHEHLAVYDQGFSQLSEVESSAGRLSLHLGQGLSLNQTLLAARYIEIQPLK